MRSRSSTNLILLTDLLGRLRGVSDWSISRKLIAMTLLLSLVPLVALTFLFTDQSSDALSASAERALEQQAFTSTEVLNNAIDKAAQDTLLLTTSDFLYSQSVGPGTKRDFLTQHDNIWGYGDIAVFTTAGKLFAGTGENYTDQAEEDYFAKVIALPDGQVYFSDIATDAATGQVAVQVAAPAYNPAGIQLGVVRVLWTANSLQQIMADIASSGSNVTVDLINSQKTIVASTNPADVGRDYAESASAIAAVSGVAGSKVEQLTTTIDGSETTSTVITGHAPIRETERLAGLGWGVVVHQNEAEALAAVQDQRSFAAILLFVAAALARGVADRYSVLLPSLDLDRPKRIAVSRRECTDLVGEIEFVGVIDRADLLQVGVEALHLNKLKPEARQTDHLDIGVVLILSLLDRPCFDRRSDHVAHVLGFRPRLKEASHQTAVVLDDAGLCLPFGFGGEAKRRAVGNASQPADAAKAGVLRRLFSVRCANASCR